MNKENCSKCPSEDSCKAWKISQIEKGLTQEIRDDLKEILESYCPIPSYACSIAIRGSMNNKAA